MSVRCLRCSPPAACSTPSPSAGSGAPGGPGRGGAARRSPPARRAVSALPHTALRAELSTRSPALHAAVHLHLLAAGCAFCWPLVGVDPTPGRPPHAVRLLAVAAAGPSHAVLGLALLGVDEAAASAVWISGELFTVTALCLALGQWLAAERRAARRAEALRWGPAA
ncbi:MAG: cytochrome c oxidase assembly protein [Acidimicrobiales bacterium]